MLFHQWSMVRRTTRVDRIGSRIVEAQFALIMHALTIQQKLYLWGSIVPGSRRLVTDDVTGEEEHAFDATSETSIAGEANGSTSNTGLGEGQRGHASGGGESDGGDGAAGAVVGATGNAKAGNKAAVMRRRSTDSVARYNVRLACSLSLQVPASFPPPNGRSHTVASP